MVNTVGKKPTQRADAAGTGRISVDSSAPRAGLSWFGRLALSLGRVAARSARRVGFNGEMIGGRVALVVYPGVLAQLAAGRRIALVSGTNGKTTTTAMLAAALRTVEPVASNSSGANMLDGITAELANNSARTVVAEIDELYLPHAVTQTNAQVLVLLNLSRDQLDRSGEIRLIAARLRKLAPQHPDLLVVANCDDPHVVHIASKFVKVVWVSAGTGWWGDAGSCPACGHHLTGEGLDWSCQSCGLSRPQPSAESIDEPSVIGSGEADQPAHRAQVPLQLQVPGAFNQANAAMAIAAAHALGVPVEDAARAVTEVTEVAGRFGVWQVGSHSIRLILAKNPAGWAATIDMLCSEPAPVVICVNAGEADGRDTSWLYDVEFERLTEHTVLAAGDHAADVGVRLSYAGVQHRTIGDPLAAVESLEPGSVYLVCDYTSFSRARTRLSRDSK